MNLAGNESAQQLAGNAAANFLTGQGGNDVLRRLRDDLAYPVT